MKFLISKNEGPFSEIEAKGDLDALRKFVGGDTVRMKCTKYPTGELFARCEKTGDTFVVKDEDEQKG